MKVSAGRIFSGGSKGEPISLLFPVPRKAYNFISLHFSGSCSFLHLQSQKFCVFKLLPELLCSPPPPPSTPLSSVIKLWKLCLLKSVSTSAICHIYHKITASKEWTGHGRSPWLNFPRTFEGPVYTTLSRMSPSPEFWGTRGSFFSREAYPISGQLSKENCISL